MQLSVAKNVTLLGLQPQMLLAHTVVLQVLDEKGAKQVVITAVTNGKHMAGSRHGFGLAVDYDPVEFGPAQMRDAATEIERRLPDEFDIVAHDSHIHVEWDRK